MFSSGNVLDINPANLKATLIADLGVANALPSNQYDCFILTQTLQFIYETQAAVGNAYRLLRPGGVLLVTVPATSRIARGAGLQNDYWRFTTASCSTLFGALFGGRANNCTCLW